MEKLLPFDAWLKKAVQVANEMRRTKRITKKKVETAQRYIGRAEFHYYSMIEHGLEDTAPESADLTFVYDTMREVAGL